MAGALFWMFYEYLQFKLQNYFTDLVLDHPVCWDCKCHSDQAKGEVRGQDPSQMSGTVVFLQVFTWERREGKLGKNKRMGKRVIIHGSILFKTIIFVPVTLKIISSNDWNFSKQCIMFR